MVAWFQSVVAAIPGEVAILFGIALLISAGGFYRLVYFVSIGYAFSVMAMAIVSAVLFRESVGWLVLLHCLALAIYGLRLGSYLLLRELQPSYRRELVEVQKRAVGVGAGKKILIWIGVSLLYVLMFSPALFNLDLQRQTGVPSSSVLLAIGLVVMFLGLSLEGLADFQKSAFKKKNPERFCDAGLYRWVRCPNYLGEIIFWVGNWLAALLAYNHWLRWVFGLVGLICIVLIMMGATKRLEQKQGERYGELPEYQEYIQSVPVLFPFVPLYSLKKVRVYLE
jgi:steroid 5-alpha reductase family enzyme